MHTTHLDTYALGTGVYSPVSSTGAIIHWLLLLLAAATAADGRLDAIVMYLRTSPKCSCAYAIDAFHIIVLMQLIPRLFLFIYSDKCRLQSQVCMSYFT